MGVREEPYREEDGTLALALTRRSRSKRPERRRWNISGLLGWEATPPFLALRFRPSSRLRRRSFNFTGPNGSQEADPRNNGGRPSPTMCSHESATNRSTTSPPKTLWPAWLLSGIPDPQRPDGPSSGSRPLCVGASLTVTEQTTRRTTESQPVWVRTTSGPSTSSPYTTVEWLPPLPRFESPRPIRRFAL